MCIPPILESAKYASLICDALTAKLYFASVTRTAREIFLTNVIWDILRTMVDGLLSLRCICRGGRGRQSKLPSWIYSWHRNKLPGLPQGKAAGALQQQLITYAFFFPSRGLFLYWKSSKAMSKNSLIDSWEEEGAGRSEGGISIGLGKLPSREH